MTFKEIPLKEPSGITIDASMRPVKIEVEILTPLKYQDMLNGREVKLTKPFKVKLIEHYSDGTIEVRIIKVPVDFISDLASVPRPIQWLVPRFGKYNAAAVVHDWLFIHGKIEGEPITRRLADQIFLAIMKESGCGWRKRPMFAAVRMFGYQLWKNNRKNEKVKK